MPSRSPADATRFTSTGPHASHQFTRSASASTTSPPPSSTMPGGSGAGAVPGETPQQRIARLRQAATAAKMENITLMDKLYVHGRVWADRLHRATALGLIGATILCGGVTVFTLTQMIIHTRKLKKEHAEEVKRLKDLEAAERQEIEKMSLVTTGGSPVAEALTPEERERGKGIVANLKSWSLYGLTPSKDEFKDRWDKEGGGDVAVEGTQTKWLPTQEGRKSEGATGVPESGKFEQRQAERESSGKDAVQGKGMFAGVSSWFGR